MNPPVKIPKLLWLILILFLLVSIVTTVIAIKNPSGRSYPRTIQVSLPGPIGIQGIQGVGGLQGPQGISGVQGSTGLQGNQGPIGIQGSTGLTGMQGDTGPQGPPGNPGEPGQPGREIEVRHNDAKAETEWRYTDDLTWFVLVKDCTITNNCGP